MRLLDLETEYLREKNTYQVEFDLADQVKDIFQTLLIGGESIRGRYRPDDKMKGYEIHMGVSKITSSNNRLLPLFHVCSRGKENIRLEDGLVWREKKKKKMMLGT